MNDICQQGKIHIPAGEKSHRIVELESRQFHGLSTVQLLFTAGQIMPVGLQDARYNLMGDPSFEYLELRLRGPADR
jgi:hypothetical protein